MTKDNILYCSIKLAFLLTVHMFGSCNESTWQLHMGRGHHTANAGGWHTRESKSWRRCLIRGTKTLWQFWARDIGWRNVVRDLPNSSLDTEPTSTQLQRPSNNTETAFIVTSFLAFVHKNKNNNNFCTALFSSVQKLTALSYISQHFLSKREKNRR